MVFLIILIIESLVLGNSVTGYCKFTFLLCKRFGTHFTVMCSSTQACVWLWVCVVCYPGGFLLICILLKGAAAWLYGKDGELSIIHSVILSFLYLLKSLFHAYKWISIAHLDGKWKWKSNKSILSLYKADFSYAYFCTNVFLFHLVC